MTGQKLVCQSKKEDTMVLEVIKERIDKCSFLLRWQKDKLLDLLFEYGAQEPRGEVLSLIKEVLNRLLGIQMVDLSTDEQIVINQVIKDLGWLE